MAASLLVACGGKTSPPRPLGPPAAPVVECSAEPCSRDVGVGQSNVCVATSEGEVRCWGGNSNGESGAPNAGTAGGSDGILVPTKVGTLSSASTISAAWFTACARTPGDTLCWGETGMIDLTTGERTGDAHPVPARVPGVSQVAAGHGHLCAVGTGGTASCLGFNGDGQLGSGTATTEVQTEFSEVMHLSDVMQIAAGAGSTCALLRDERVGCWGLNDEHQIGPWDASTMTLENQKVQLEPRMLPELSNVRQLGLGFKHGCALEESGKVLCWGLNDSGQTGGLPGALAWPPREVPGLSSAVRLSVGDRTSCALRSDRTVWCWGSNANGVLGNGEFDDQPHASPLHVNVDEAVQVAAGAGVACALSSRGQVSCWGGNQLGQMGSGVRDDSPHGPTASTW